MSFASNADTLRISNLSNRKTILDKQTPCKENTIKCCQVTFGLGSVFNKVGSLPLIIYNSLLLFVAFVLLFQMFPESRRFNTRSMLTEQMVPEHYEGVHDFGSFFDFLDHFIDAGYTSSKDFNGIDQSNIKYRGNKQYAFVWNSLSITQERDEEITICTALTKMLDPVAKSKYQNSLLYQGYDCNDSTLRSKFGKEVIKHRNGTLTMQKCPYFPETHSMITTNPFLPFVSGMFGYQKDTLPDHRENKYVLTLTQFQLMMASKKLRNCHWLDMRTRKVTVSGMYMNSATEEVGELVYEFQFSSAGSVSKTRSVSVADVTDPDRQTKHLNPNTQGGQISELIIIITIFHKAFTNVFKLLLRMMRCVCGKKKKKKKNKDEDEDEDADETHLKKSFKMSFTEFLVIKCEVATVILSMGVTYYSKQREIVKGDLQKLLSDLGSKGLSRAEIQMMPIKMIENKLRIVGLTEDEMYTNQYAMDRLGNFIRNLTNIDQQYKFLISLFLINASVDLMRHFYANPTFSIVPKTLTFSANKLSLLLIIIVTFIGGNGTYIVVFYSSYSDSFASIVPTSVTLWNSMLGDVDYYDDLMDVLPSQVEKLIFFGNHILWSLLVLITVFNITVTVIMDAYARAKEVEDKKNELLHTLNNKDHISARLQQERWKSAKRKTIDDIQTIARKRKEEMKTGSLVSVVPGTPVPMESPLNSPSNERSSVPGTTSVDNWMQIDENQVEKMNREN